MMVGRIIFNDFARIRCVHSTGKPSRIVSDSVREELRWMCIGGNILQVDSEVDRVVNIYIYCWSILFTSLGALGVALRLNSWYQWGLVRCSSGALGWMA